MECGQEVFFCLLPFPHPKGKTRLSVGYGLVGLRGACRASRLYRVLPGVGSGALSSSRRRTVR